MKHGRAVEICLQRYAEYVGPGSTAPPKNGYARGFVTPSRRQLAIETQSDSETTNVWLQDVGQPQTDCRTVFYPVQKTRTSALSSVAPSLSGPGYKKPAFPAYKVYVTSEAELLTLLEWYEERA